MTSATQFHCPKLYDSPSITAWTVVVGFFSHQGHELLTRLLLSGLWPSQKSALVNFLLLRFVADNPSNKKVKFNFPIELSETADFVYNFV